MLTEMIDTRWISENNYDTMEIDDETYGWNEAAILKRYQEEEKPNFVYRYYVDLYGYSAVTLLCVYENKTIHSSLQKISHIYGKLPKDLYLSDFLSECIQVKRKPGQSPQTYLQDRDTLQEEYVKYKKYVYV